MDDESRALFPGWRWAAIALAIPIAGLIGWAISGPVDAPAAALLGGILTGAGIGAAQWLAARETFGDWRVWVGTTALTYGVGLTIGAAVVGYETDIGSLALMGAITGVFLGAGQALVLSQQARGGLALVWGAAMPAMLGLGWVATTFIGVDVDEQFTVFGAMGAVVFTALSGVLLARYRPFVAGSAV